MIRGSLFRFNKRAELFVGMHNKAPSVAAVRICDKDRCPLELIVETQPQLQPALLSLSAMISHYFTNPTSLVGVLNRLRCRFTQFKLCVHFL
jgi:hypothetical protein